MRFEQGGNPERPVRARRRRAVARMQARREQGGPAGAGTSDAAPRPIRVPRGKAAERRRRGAVLGGVGGGAAALVLRVLTAALRDQDGAAGFERGARTEERATRAQWPCITVRTASGGANWLSLTVAAYLARIRASTAGTGAQARGPGARATSYAALNGPAGGDEGGPNSALPQYRSGHVTVVITGHFPVKRIFR